MSQRCFLEVYTKHNKLKDNNQIEYWNKYLEVVEPVLSDITNPNNGVIFDDKFYELLPEYKDSMYPMKYYSKTDKDCFVYDNQLSCKYFVPDTFLMPFKRDDLEHSCKENYDNMNDQFSWGYLSCKTTVGEGLETIKTRVAKLEESEFKNSCNEVIAFLKEMPSDSLLVLNSADIYIEEDPQFLLEEVEGAYALFDRMDNR